MQCRRAIEACPDVSVTTDTIARRHGMCGSPCYLPNDPLDGAEDTDDFGQHRTNMGPFAMVWNARTDGPITARIYKVYLVRRSARNMQRSRRLQGAISLRWRALLAVLPASRPAARPASKHETGIRRPLETSVEKRERVRNDVVIGACGILRRHTESAVVFVQSPMPAAYSQSAVNFPS